MADRKKVTDIIGAVFNGKDSKRGVDYRTSLMKVCCHFKKEYPESNFTEILHTLCEIQKVLYQQESHRTNENILHLYVQTFLINFEKNIKSMSTRKVFGKYYHAIISHASDQYRIVNGRSSNTESDERYFHTIKDISNNTSNHHPDNIISNAFIRCQVQKDFHENDTILRGEASITKMYTKMSMDLTNSFISFEVIKMYPWEYQAFLEKIADFLMEERVYWTELSNGIQFNDIKRVESKKEVHHFRSYSVCSELDYVQYSWQNSCLKTPDKLIPAFKVKEEDHAGIPSITILKTLHCFTENEGENSLLQTLEIIETQSSFQLSNINSPRKHNFLTSTPNNRNSFLKESTLSISNIKENDVNMSSNNEEILPITAEINYEAQVTDIGDGNAQEGVLQITIAEPVIVLPNQVGNDYHTTTLQLIDVLGESKLVTEYDKYKRKLEKYPGEEMYLDDLHKIIAQLEVKGKTEG